MGISASNLQCLYGSLMANSKVQIDTRQKIVFTSVRDVAVLESRQSRF